MPTTFLETGGDSTYTVTTPTNRGFWTAISGPPILSTDFVHGTHINSIGFTTGAGGGRFCSKAAILADAGSRLSFYVYFAAFPSSTVSIARLSTTGLGNVVASIYITSTGVLQIWDANTAQIGANGDTLSTGVWYRISLAYTITSTGVNRFELFKNGRQTISITNATLTRTGTADLQLGNPMANAALDFRVSDIYVDDSSALTDTGDIWVTAKRPNANGTTNGFSTQIGASGSGYGTGHSPQVNERALSTANGWSMVGAGAQVTEEYNIENSITGDISIDGTIVDYVGWVYISSLVAETILIEVNGVYSGQAITSTNTMYTKVAGSTTYPSGTGQDIGVVTDTSLTTVSLFECGVIVAYKVVVPKSTFKTGLNRPLKPALFKPGNAR